MWARNLFHRIGILVLVVFTLAPVPAAQADDGAIITVNTTLDDVANNGNCSLREAIIAANLDQPVDACPSGIGADTIFLPEGAYTLQVTGINENDSLQGDLDIRAPVTLEGGGAGASIQGFGVGIPYFERDRILEVWYAAGSVHLVHITIAGSASGMRGAGIYNSADLTLEDSAVLENRMDESGATFGGGIYNQGDLHLLNSQFSGNYAPCGGGLYNTGRVWITGGSFSGNSAARYSWGGAIFNNGSMWIVTSAFTQNVAGGAGAISNSGDLVMTDSQMDENLSLMVAGAFGNGRTARLENVSVQSNHSNGEVGAIQNSGTLEIINSVIYGNSNDNGLGTVYQLEGSLTVEDTSINGNSSARNGGALMAYNGDILLRRVEMKDNRAYNGGAIYAGANLTLEDCTITGNQAIQYGGGIGQFGGQFTILRSLIEGNATGEKGGGVYQEGGSLSIHESEVSGNTAGSWGGGFYLGAQAEVIHTTVAQNTAQYGGGLYSPGQVQVRVSEFYRNNAEINGGAIYTTGQMEVTNSQMHENTGVMGGGGIVNTGRLDLQNSAIDGNTAVGRGGGIVNIGSLDLSDSSLVANISQDFGGGVCNEGIMTVTNTTFSLNRGKFGGGLGITNGTTSLLNVTLMDNTVVMEPGNAAGGGGINLWNGELTIQNSAVAGNHYASGETGPFQDCILFTGYAILNNLGNNLIGIGDGCGWPAAPGDQTGTQANPLDPGLLPLQYAGITRFHLPAEGSPLVDAASLSACPATDQRGVIRPRGSGCDIGAVEVEAATLLRQIDILPKPGVNRIDISRPGLVPVAVLSTPHFNAPAVVMRERLTFGRTGLEDSLWWKLPGVAACTAMDVNNDGQPDLLCNFRVELTGFRCGDSLGHLLGYTTQGERFTGQDAVVPVPCK
jgi:CSLREA domain-containing protein